MSSFTVKTTIAAPVGAVWAALADIGTIADWNPGVHASHVTTDVATGIAASRYCDLGGRNYLTERVVGWVPVRLLIMRVVDTNLPMAAVDIRFVLAANGAGTQVTLTPTYTVKYGWIGHLLDRFYVRSTYRQGMIALLSGLKGYVEKEMVGGKLS